MNCTVKKNTCFLNLTLQIKAEGSVAHMSARMLVNWALEEY